MTKATRYGIIYCAMTIISIMALLTIRPVAQSPAPSNTVKADQTGAVILPEQNDTSSVIELKLADDVLYFTEYSADGTVKKESVIDYIDIYSLYPEQISSLKKGVSFTTGESAAEFIQDLGS